MTIKSDRSHTVYARRQHCNGLRDEQLRINFIMFIQSFIYLQDIDDPKFIHLLLFTFNFNFSKQCPP